MKGRSPGCVVGVVVIAAAAGAVAWWAHSSKQRQAFERARHAWATYERCIIGTPLARGESIASRLRAVELAFSFDVTYHAKASQPENRWPKYCETYAKAVQIALEESLADARTLGLRRAMAKLTSTSSWALPPPAPSQQTWSRLHAALAGGRHDPSVSPPPSTEKPLLHAQLLDAQRHSIGGETLRAVESGRMIFSGSYAANGRVEMQRPLLCEIVVVGVSDARLRCAAMPTECGKPIRSANDRPLYVRCAGRQGMIHSAMYDAVTGHAVGPRVLDGYVRADGSYLGITDGDKERALAHVQSGKLRTRTKLPPTPGGRTVQDLLIGDWLLTTDEWREHEYALIATRIDSEARLGPSERVDAFGDVDDHAFACGDERGFAVVAYAPVDLTTADAFVVFGDRKSIHASSPVRVPVKSRVDCRPGRVTLTWADNTNPRTSKGEPVTLKRALCLASGCTTATWKAPPFVEANDGRHIVIDRGTNAAFVFWPYKGPLQVCTGPWDAEPFECHALIDTPEHGGIEVKSVVVVERGQATLVLVNEFEHTHFVRLDEHARPKPVSVEWLKAANPPQ